jgi:hypothetical protein
MANQIIGNPSRALDANGYVVPGGKMTVYQTGTATLLPVYVDVDGATPAANPVIADASGVFPQRFVLEQAAKIVVTTADDVTLYTLDPAPVVQGTGSGASQISFSPTALVPETDVQAAIEAVANLTTFTQLSGRNRIINGDGRVNQREYVSGTATTVANQYTLDRWRVVVSGQNLAFTGSNASRVMTAPAGGVEQVIEAANIVSGTYTINWSGTATCTVNGVAREKRATFTLSSNTAVTVRFTGGTFTDAQIELGTTPTPFERRSYTAELAECQRYYWRGLPCAAISFPSYADASNMAFLVNFPVTMRAEPTTSYDATGATLTATTIVNFASATPHGARLLLQSTSVTTNASVQFIFGNYLEATAEL